MAYIRPAERVAKSVLEALRPGSEMRHVCDQSHGEHDFDWAVEDGAVEAVEVTAFVDKTRVELDAALHKKGGRNSIGAQYCKLSWIVWLLPNANVLAVRSQIDSVLASCEVQGISRVDWQGAWNEDIASTFQLLGISGAQVIDTQRVPQILLQQAAHGGAVGPAVAIEAAAAEWSKADNLLKLGCSNATRRHLAIFFDPCNHVGSAWAAITDWNPPPGMPELPDEITDIWLIAPWSQMAEYREYVVWSAGNSRAWESTRAKVPSSASPAS